MTIAILATGDEIIHGDTLNTNAHVIAKALSSEGLPLGLHLTCSDKEKELNDSIRFLLEHHTIILSIGGLGPTSDDRTRFAFARTLGLDLVEYPEALEHIQARLNRASLPFDSGNRLQALFPAHSTLLPNSNGTAMGCIFSAQEKLFILLPGPPSECLQMFDNSVLPYLQKMQHSHKQLLSWQLFGVAEGQVAEQLEKALLGIDCSTGYRLDMPYLEFKVRCEALTAEQVKQIVDPLVASYIISPPKRKASQLLREQLVLMNKSVSIIDRATGGVLETLLRRPENAAFLSFYDKKGSDFYCEITGIDAYWESDNSSTRTELVMKYHNQKSSGEERHSIPYRGHSHVLGYAAEWLSFRILKIMNSIFD